MQCFVYKSSDKVDHFLYLPSDLAESKESLPDALLSMLGELEMVIEFDLLPDRKMPNADAVNVIEQLQDQGFYLQMPKKNMYAVEDEMFSQASEIVTQALY